MINEDDKADDLDDEIDEGGIDIDLDEEVDDIDGEDEIEEDEAPHASCDGIDDFNCIQLNAHNYYRCRYGVPPLEYDSFLAKLA